jgi:hypothetical protein
MVNESDLTKALRINMDGISINEISAASNEFPLDAVFDLAVEVTYMLNCGSGFECPNWRHLISG